MTELSADARPRLSPAFRLQWEEAQEAWVLLYPEGMVKLNRPAAEILKRCDGEANFRELVAQVESAFGQGDLEDDVRDFVRTAIARGWLRV